MIVSELKKTLTTLDPTLSVDGYRVKGDNFIAPSHKYEYTINGKVYTRKMLSELLGVTRSGVHYLHKKGVLEEKVIHTLNKMA